MGRGSLAPGGVDGVGGHGGAHESAGASSLHLGGSVSALGFRGARRCCVPWAFGLLWSQALQGEGGAEARLCVRSRQVCAHLGSQPAPRVPGGARGKHSSGRVSLDRQVHPQGCQPAGSSESRVRQAVGRAGTEEEKAEGRRAMQELMWGPSPSDVSRSVDPRALGFPGRAG